MDEKDLKKVIDEATDNEDLKKLHADTKEDLGNFGEEIKERISTIESHAATNKIMNLAQVADVVQRREGDKVLRGIADRTEEGIRAEASHNKGAKSSRKRIEASLDSLHKKVDTGVGMGGGSGGGGDDAGPRIRNIGAVLGNLMPTKIGSDQIKGGAGTNLKLMAQADSSVLEQAMLKDSEGEGELGKRISKFLEATRKQQKTGDAVEAKEELAKLTAYQQRTGIDTGLDLEALQKGTQKQGMFSKQNIKEKLGVSQGDDLSVSGFVEQKSQNLLDSIDKFKEVLKNPFGGQSRANEKEFQGMVGTAVAQQDQKSVSETLEKFFKGEDFQKRDPEKIDPRKALVSSRTGQDTETVQEKQLEVLEEIRDILLDMQGGMDEGGGMPLVPRSGPARTRTPGSKTPRTKTPGPRTKTPNVRPSGPKVPKGGFTSPAQAPKGVDLVKSKSGKFFPANSPQGQMIQNMTKNADVVDDVAKAAPKPSATGKVIRGAAKGLGVLGVAVDAGFRISDDMAQRDLLERAQAGDETATDQRTGDIYTEESADADRVENVSGFGGGLVGAAAGGAAGAKGGAALGAAIGSIIPGAGTVAGAAVGGFIGGVGGSVMGYFAGSAAGQEAGDALTTNDAEKEIEKLESDGAFEKVIFGNSTINREKMKEVGTVKNITSLLSQEGDDLSEDDIAFLTDLKDQKANTAATMEQVQSSTAGTVDMSTDPVTGQAVAETSPTADAVGNMTDLAEGLDFAAMQPVINIANNAVTGAQQGGQDAIAAVMKATSRFPLDDNMTKVLSNYKIVQTFSNLTINLSARLVT